MPDVPVRPARPTTQAVRTAPSRTTAAGHRPRRPAGRRRPGIFGGRVLLVGLGLAVAWGLFLWVFIGSSIASFGNPWLYG